MTTGIIILLIGAAILYGKTKIDGYTADIQAGKLTAWVDVDMKGINKSNGVINIPLMVRLSNGMDMEAQLENLFIKMFIINRDGTRTFFAQSSPELTSALLSPYSTTTVHETVQAPITTLLSLSFGILSMQGIYVEVYPTVAGVELPMIESTFNYSLAQFLV